jgi:hypothetical protein
MLLTREKDEMIERITRAIQDIDCDIINELTDEAEANSLKIDRDSLKTVLGHLITLKHC